MQAQGGSARLAAGIAHHYLSAGDQPAAFAAAVRAADKADEVHAHGEAAHAVRARAAAVVARARPRGAGGHRPRRRCCAGPADAHHDKPRRRGALRGGAERDRRDGRAVTAPPTCSSAWPTCAGGWAPPSAAWPRSSAAWRCCPTTTAAPSARCCSACGRSSSCCAAAIAAPSRRPGRRWTRPRRPASPRRAAARSTPWARRSWPSARSTAARASCARRSSWRSPTGACREMRAAYINLADLLHQRGRSEEGRRRRPRGRRAHRPAPAGAARG